MVQWKGFTAEHDTWEKREDLENAKKALEEFEGRMDVEVRRQEKLDMVEKKGLQERRITRKIHSKKCYMDGMTESLKRSI